MHRTALPVDPTPAADMLRLWRDASALAQEFDEMLLAVAPESVDFIVLARARRWQHKAARVLAGRLQVAGRAGVGGPIGKAGRARGIASRVG